MANNDWLELGLLDPEAHALRLRDECAQDLDACRVALNSIRLAYQILPDRIRGSVALGHVRRSPGQLLLSLLGGPGLHRQLRNVVAEAIAQSRTPVAWRAVTPCLWAQLIQVCGLLQQPRQESVMLGPWPVVQGLLVQLALRRELPEEELATLHGADSDAARDLVRAVLREVGSFTNVPRGFLRPMDVVAATDEEEVEWDLRPSIVAGVLKDGLVQRVADWSPLHPECPTGLSEAPVQDERGRWLLTIRHVLRAAKWGFDGGTP